MSKPTNEWYCKDLRNTVINRQKREINKLNKENEKIKNKIKERIMLESFDYFGKRCIKVEDIEDLLEDEED